MGTDPLISKVCGKKGTSSPSLSPPELPHLDLLVVRPTAPNLPISPTDKMAPINFTARIVVFVCACLGLTLLALHGSGGVSRLQVYRDIGKHMEVSKYDKLLDTVRNKTLGFEKIFVITMPARIDHRDTLALASALTPGGGLKLDIVDGVTSLPSKMELPPWGRKQNETGKRFDLSKQDEVPNWLKCWRAHINVLQHIVENRISSAMIAESDFDWDVNLKTQMQQFAKSSALLVHAKDGSEAPMHPSDAPAKFSSMPTRSAYGSLDSWDVLWLGHCGTVAPMPDDGLALPRDRVTFQDPTVAEIPRLSPGYKNDHILATEYANHTRMVHWFAGGVCLPAYAVSLQGAQKILHAIGIHRMYAAVDIMLENWCTTGFGDNAPHGRCITVQPPMFSNHLPAGPTRGFSDINDDDQDGAFNFNPHTWNIRYSTKMNIEKLANGRTDYIDQFPDEVQAG